MSAIIHALKSSLDNFKGKSMLVALSGGHDSMVLCHALLELKISFSCAHCNYRLRGEESDKDAIFIQEFCAHYKIPLHLKIQPINGLETSNIQEKARNIRNDFFKKIMKDNSYDYLLVAHHAEDRIESFLINLIRGSGLNGLGTMPAYNQSIIRPFIHLSKSDLNSFAEERKIQWREDSSNSEDKYVRNILRH
ncbi:MAG: tRNA lysidine(34) synthetase TilS, partial [Saprospiraceae bacterium]